MTDELKPCPFCPDGGSPELEQVGDDWHINCENEKCPATAFVIGSSEQEAIKAWNTRYERTCHKVPGKMHYGELRPKCSECGYGLGDSRWVFCPKCGAEILHD